MKQNHTLLTALGLAISAAAFVGGGSTASLQVVHNCADAAASTVDVYVNGDLFLDDLDFRTASAFVDVPA